MQSLTIVKLFPIFWSASGCVLEYRKMDYFKIRTCHRSLLPQTGSKDVQDLRECVHFAKERNGLAFNFGPREFSEEKSHVEDSPKNCQIMGCPELGNGTTLIPDEMFDYYSAFGNMNATQNATCISSTGIFAITQEKENYVDSISNCQKIGADLADVMSESRTKQLANLINITVNSWYKASYVGLDDLPNTGRFESPSGNRLSCTRYRAWGPGHPRTKENCVSLHSDRTWRTNPCEVKLTAVCEFFPESPSVGELDERRACDKISSKRRKRRCLDDKRSLRKLINKSSRRDKCAILNYDKTLPRN